MESKLERVVQLIRRIASTPSHMRHIPTIVDYILSDPKLPESGWPLFEQKYRKNHFLHSGHPIFPFSNLLRKLRIFPQYIENVDSFCHRASTFVASIDSKLQGTIYTLHELIPILLHILINLSTDKNCFENNSLFEALQFLIDINKECQKTHNVELLSRAYEAAIESGAESYAYAYAYRQDRIKYQERMMLLFCVSLFSVFDQDAPSLKLGHSISLRYDGGLLESLLCTEEALDAQCSHFANYKPGLKGLASVWRLVYLFNQVDFKALNCPQGLPVIIWGLVTSFPDPELGIHFFKLHARLMQTKEAKTNPKAIHDFYMIHFYKIKDFLELTGVYGILYLQSQFAQHITPLNTILERFTSFSDDTVVRHVSERVKNDADVRQALQLATLVELLKKQNPGYSCEVALCSKYIEPHNSLEESIKSIFREVFSLLHLDLDDASFNKFLKENSIERLGMLIPAFSTMLSSPYMVIFKYYILQDFFPHLSLTFEELASFSPQLQAHNEQIRTVLSTQGPVDRMVQYPKTKRIEVILKADKAEQSEQIKAWWSYIQELRRFLGFLASFPDFVKKLELIETRISILEKAIEDSKGVGITVVLSRPDMVAHITKINEVLKSIYYSQERLLVTEDEHQKQSFLEFAKHAFDISFEGIKQIKKEDRTTRTFNIKQWNKSNAATFFLGNDVSCCLATDSPQFAAMVQRRMDDAMFFHVALDEHAKPVALCWLYFAQIQVDGESKLAVIANFFEVNSGIANTPVLRKALLHALIEYTTEFANEQGMEFYMANLYYGYNKEDLTPYSPVGDRFKIIDKVGGALVLNKDEYSESEQDEYSQGSQVQDTQKFYYLQSLEPNRTFFLGSVEVARRELRESTRTIIAASGVPATLLQPKPSHSSDHPSRLYSGPDTPGKSS